jgi:phosphohistidine phosphatase
MQLLIIRHAIAHERDARRWREDGLRPLSPQGMVRARQAAQGLKRLGPRPARLLTSPLLRARQTATILNASAGWPKPVPCAELLPGAPPEELLAVLAHLGAERIAVVGHEPDLGELLAACLGGATRGAFRFRKMGGALVDFRTSARAGRGQLLWFLPPRVLRASAR